MTRYRDELSDTKINIGYSARDPRIDESHYTKVLIDAGANPIRFGDDVEDLGDFIDCIDGMLFTGGIDVCPTYYGEDIEPEEKGLPMDLEWDKREGELVRIARDKGLPVLANCRGLQIVNAALGGTLHQDIIDDHVSTFNHDVHPRIVNQTVHEVYIDKGSKLADIFKKIVEPHDEDTVKMPVNSSHHQSVDKVAPDLTLTTKAMDGVIEGLELVDDKHPFFICVQWHPEDLTDNHILHDLLIQHAWEYRNSR